ncbi:MAG: dTDP-4-dehydrorhamnose reductase [Acidimicrobiia bacterium]
MRFFLTGANGQVGTEVRAHFERRANPADEVIATDADTVDLGDRDAILGAICSTEPDVILHIGAMTAVDACEERPDDAYRINALATRHVADAARRVGAHVVYVSTDYVFDGTKDAPYHEWDTPNPRSVYGRSKLGGEQALGPDATVVRTSWVCGYHGANMVKTVLRVAAQPGELRFVADQVGHPTFAADLAPMLVRLGVERRPGTFHVTNQGAVSWHGFVQEILRAAGDDPARVVPIRTDELDPPRPAPRPANSVLDNAALRLSGLPLLDDFRVPLARLVSQLQHA